MASSTQKPSSSSTSIHKYTFEVFLSFRGEDTRYNFTDHLFEKLDGMGIHTFRDDQLERGEEIKSELLKTIEESRISIVVFSKTYAHSKWCLDELSKIMECREEMEQIVLPVFYHVDPSDVRKQRGSFGEAFSIHERHVDEKKVQRWRDSLNKASNLGGFHVNDGYESKHIKEITNEIFERLNPKLLHIDDDMVGIDFRLKELELLLSSHLNDLKEVGVIGIYGTGGIGKTTIAKIIYNEIQCQFNGASFLQDVRGRSKNGHQLQLLQQLLSGVVGKDVEFSDINEGINIIKGRLSSKKVLIAIDDVDHLEQLKLLVGSRKWFGMGSRIIITTRDKHLLDEYEVDISYEVKQLHYEEAIQLFSRHAFKHNVPKEDYVDLSNCMVDYAQGLPLALKVLGSSLHGMTIDEWKSALDKLKKNPKKEINDVLRISFDGLDHYEKEVFLDIACFFKWEHKDIVLRILDGCKLFATCGIRVLCDRCLVTISHNNVIQMHDLIQQMGWAIVREECPEDPSKQSRLWDMDDIYDAFLRQGGMKNIQTISLDSSRSKEIEFTRKAFAKMKKLRLLEVYCNGLMREKYKVLLPKDFEFPHNLRYFHWQGCTLRSLRSNFFGENLIEINLKSSNIKQLWKGNKCLGKLKAIDLSNSKRLVKLSKFSSVPNLERLNLQGCTSLRELHSSIGNLKGLTYLNLGGCEQIRSFPTSMKFESLEVLYLGCPKLKKFPEIHGNMEYLKELYLNGSGIKELPSSIVYLASLEVLNLSNCSNLEKFPEIHGNMKFLRELHLEECSKFEKFPDTFTSMEHLRKLRLRESGVKELPGSIGYLESLESLDLSYCSNFEKFPEIQGNMKCLKTLDLRRTAITELPNSIGSLQALEFLYLHGCSNFERFPEIQNNMGSLRFLFLEGTAIKELPCSIGHLTRLAHLYLEKCKNLRSLPNRLVHLRSLHCCLRWLDLGGCNLMEGEIPSDLWGLSSLFLLDLSKNHIRCIPAGITQLSKLNSLFMNHCPMLEEIGELPSSLEWIEAHGCPCLETETSSRLLWASLLKRFKSPIQRKCSIVVPGSSGIPEWVSHRRMGREVKIELPMNWYEDNNLLGFVLFLHHVPLHDDDCETIRGYLPQFELTISHGDGDQSEEVGSIDSARCYNSSSTSDPAMSVMYFPQIEIPSKYRSRRWNNFKAHGYGSFSCGSNSYGSISYGSSCGSSRGFFRYGDERPFKVKSCGIHLIYAQDQNHWPQPIRESPGDTEDHPTKKLSIL